MNQTFCLEVMGQVKDNLVHELIPCARFTQTAPTGFRGQIEHNVMLMYLHHLNSFCFVLFFGWEAKIFW